MQRQAAAKLINQAKKDRRLTGLFELKHGVDRLLRDLKDPKRPKMVCSCRLKQEIALLEAMKQELKVLVPKPNLKPWSSNGITKVIYLTSK